MSLGHGSSIVRDGLLVHLDAANNKIKKNALFFKWFVTNGTNPTTKAGFDAFFSVTPESIGIDVNRDIDWTVVGNRPSYITPTTSFAWEVSGFILIPESGEYVFNTRSDDGNELVINDQILTSFYGGRGVPNPGDISSPINLNSGIYTFQYRMQQGGGGAGAQVRWQRPNSSNFEVIASKYFAVGLVNSAFVDISNNNNDGVLFNGITISNNDKGALIFDGVDDYIDLPNDLGYTNQVSAFSWFKSNGTPTGGFSYYIWGSGIRNFCAYCWTNKNWCFLQILDSYLIMDRD
jgi:hypothetical protein